MDGTTVQAQITKVLAQLDATPRVVSFRTSTRTGGNPILGIGQTLVNVDTVLDPQPAVTYVTEEEVAGGLGLIQLGDYRLTVAGSVAESVLRTSQILFGSDVLKILSFQPATIGGVVAAWSILARTVKAT